MAIRYALEPELRLIVVSVSDKVLPDEVRDNRRQFVSSHEDTGDFDFLIMFDGNIDPSAFDADALKRVYEDSKIFERRGINRGKAAFVTNGSRNVTMVTKLYRAIQSTRGDSSESIEIFETLQDACSWLERDLNAVIGVLRQDDGDA